MQLGLVVGDALPVVARVLAQHEAVAEVSYLGRLGLGHLPEAERSSVQVQEGVDLGEHQPVLDHRLDSKVVQRKAVLDVAALVPIDQRLPGLGCEVAVLQLLEDLPGCVGLQHLGVPGCAALGPEDQAPGLRGNL